MRTHANMKVVSFNESSPVEPTPIQPTCKRYMIRDLTDNIQLGRLPDGWLPLWHVSGLKIYFHRVTRVVTTTRPYHIGQKNVRFHPIPMSAIPCLGYRNWKKPTEADFAEVDNNDTDADTESVQPHEILELTNPNISPHIVSDQDVEASLKRTICLMDREEGELSSEDEDGEDEGESSSTTKTNADDSKTELEQQHDDPPSKKSLVESFVSTEAATVGVSVITMKPNVVTDIRRKQKRHTVPQVSRKNRADQNSCQSTESQPLNISAESTAFQTPEQGKQFTHEEIRTYCERLFEIKVQDLKYNKPNRTYAQSNKCEKPAAEDTSGTSTEEAKVIHYQVASAEGDAKRKQLKEGLITMTGKSSVCILHEYCQHVLRRPPTYESQVVENDPNPYQVTVRIDGKPVVTGVGPNKKQARLDAAHKALSKLIPDFDKLTNSDSTVNTSGPPHVATERDIALFDNVPVTDPTIYERSIRHSLPTPYNLLVEFLNRSCIPETDLKSTMTSQGRFKHFFIMELCDNTIKVACKNKREGRHLAAQHLMSRLHPDVQFWSGVLRMYGPGSKPDKRGELESIQGAQTQEKSTVKTSLIRLLKCKMHELADQWEKTDGSNHPKGKFLVNPDSLPVVTFHPDSKTDLYSSVPVSSPSSSPLPETTSVG